MQSNGIAVKVRIFTIMLEKIACTEIWDLIIKKIRLGIQVTIMGNVWRLKLKLFLLN